MVRSKYIFFILSILLMVSCGKEHAMDCFMKSGEISSEIRIPEDFRHIELSGNIDLVLTYNSGNSYIKVETGDHLIEGIKTEVLNGRLVIFNENKCNWMRKYNVPITVFANVNTLESITYFGTGNIRSTNSLMNDSLQIQVWGGTGLIDLDVTNNSTVIAMNTGVADITLTGSSGVNYIWMAGNGYYSGYDLLAGYNFIQHFGTGECRIKCDTELDVKIYGSGNVRIKGNPLLVHSEEFGKGKLIYE